MISNHDEDYDKAEYTPASAKGVSCKVAVYILSHPRAWQGVEIVQSKRIIKIFPGKYLMIGIKPVKWAGEFFIRQEAE